MLRPASSRTEKTVPTESPVRFLNHGSHLYGMLHIPDTAPERGVLVAFGGPTRVGPHRTNVLLARELARSGLAVMRFDYRDTGDSDEILDSLYHDEVIPDARLSDIELAVDYFFRHVQSIQEIVIWGLCSGATRAIHYANKDPRVRGVVLINPYVDWKARDSLVNMKDHYWRKLTTLDSYKRIIRGDLSLVKAGRNLASKIAGAIHKHKPDAIPNEKKTYDQMPVKLSSHSQHENSLLNFKGKVLVILAGEDHIGARFDELVTRSARLKRHFESPNITFHVIPGANHTFSRKDWRNEVISCTREWVLSI